MIVYKVLWTKFNKPPSISLKPRLRRLTKKWREFISSSVEWISLKFTHLDAPGYGAYAAHQVRLSGGRFRICTRYERFSAEI